LKWGRHPLLAFRATLLSIVGNDARGKRRAPQRERKKKKEKKKRGATFVSKKEVAHA